jgi:uncharacterized delta-60 repeat protein
MNLTKRLTAFLAVVFCIYISACTGGGTHVAANTFNIVATTGTNGSISPSGTTVVSAGVSQSYTITPNAGYDIQSVTVDGVTQGAPTATFTFTNVQASHTISATFVAQVAATTFNIVATTGTNGSISPSGTTVVSAGVSQSYTITPNAVDGVTQGAPTATFTFTNVQASHTISATFVAQVAASGSLDSSFGTGGIVTTPISAFPGTDQINAIVIQSDSKIVAVGRAENDSALVRYRVDGSLDTTFGTSGVVAITTGSYYTAAVQPSDSKIVVAGVTPGLDFVLARYNTDGSIDTSFGSGGVVLTNVGATDFATSLAIQPDGKIVAAGYTESCNGPSCTGSVALARYDSSGVLDPAFGAGGVVTATVGSSMNRASGVAVQSDGKIVIAGYYTPTTGGYGWMLMRFSGTDGSLDTSFNGTGKVTTAIGINYNAYYLNDFAYSVAIQPDGKIVAAGGAGGNCVPPNCSSESHVAFARYLVDGSLDPFFGNSGTQIGNNSIAYAKSVAVQSDGKIVAAGPLTSMGAFMVTRVDATGSLDTTFGTGGEVATYSNGGFNWSEAYSIAVQADGKIVAAGYICGGYNGTNPDFALIRYWP